MLEGQDSALWEMLQYFWELSSPTLKATGTQVPACSEPENTPQFLQQQASARSSLPGWSPWPWSRDSTFNSLTLANEMLPLANRMCSP